jgi:hypothetical protein
MENISFQYPTWYILLCILLGLVYAFALYFRSKAFREQSRQLNWGLGVLRFLTVTFIAVLLLSPLLKSIIREIKKPVIVLAQDQSESINANMTDKQKIQYRQSFQQLSDDLAGDYELKEYAFGNEVREGIDFQFEDKVTNISELLQHLYDLYSNQNLGAVVIATDGIYNEGSNPIYKGTKLSAPIYTIALGDTTVKRDLILKRVFHNKIAYLGDKFSIQVDVTAQNFSGSNTFLNISKIENGNANPLQRIPISIDKNDFFITKEVVLDADKSGVQRFRVSLSQVNGEATTANNSKDIFIDVLDVRQKILILANAPHPDISAIKQSISNNKNYEVTIAYIDKLSVNVADFDFAILHQLPSRTNSASGVLKTLADRKTPLLFIAGTQTDFSQLTKIQPLVNITADQRNTNDVQAAFAKDFSLFTLDDRLVEELPRFAPLLAPFGDFKENPNADVLLFQRIGKIDTQYPLLLFGEKNNVKIGVLCAEGLWKWRLYDFLQNKNHELFDLLLSKTTQYLTLKEDKRKFRVSLDKNIFNENEPIFFDAELYNQSYELINEPDVSLTIRNEKGDDFKFTFTKNNSRSYTLNAGNFPVGNYTFHAEVMSSGQQLTYDGQFSVQPIQLEIYETTADHRLLRLLSEKYGGEMIYPAQLSSIAEKIKQKGTVLPVIYETTKTRSVINLKWIFFLLMGLLSLEWFLRRYFGTY